ncbi:NADH-quinone oxidoreductase subunit B family protein [Nitrospina gracilis]|uniref:NADH-quinone oxidoreductase subunit B family protein n=1 Tax=Nitrospina gracilis TaxID=35801 RepID=UPI001F01F27D|nr:NADH-quinone oxidoreductase subunit NuoB [Nitrospina gracilis]MCF8721272.1 Ni,Fe-hydrogenase III small subunit [Nitrospina gracilis Nb-211]
MRHLFGKIFKVGRITEPLAAGENRIEVLGRGLERKIRKHFKGSLAIRAVDAGSCNGCELEIHAMNNPYYDLEQYGVHFVASPRHADMLLVTGPVTRNMETALKMTYDAVPNPKLVVAVGDCAACGGEFNVSYASLGRVADVIPVDIVVHGCPPSPTDLIRGILSAMENLPE